MLQTLCTVGNRRCYWCRKIVGPAAVKIKHGRKAHYSCGECPQGALPPTPVGGIIGNKYEGLYRILKRRPLPDPDDEEE